MHSSQAPLKSGFGFHSTAAEVIAGIDLHGKTAIVTGGYSGIGLETTRTLVQAGATVIVPARQLDKARAALSGLPTVQLARLDLLDLAAIDTFANDLLRDGAALHLLIANAGVMASPLVRDDRGCESQLSANHLGHFYLIQALWPALQRAQGARIVTLRTGAHRRAAVDFKDPNFINRPYDRWIAYAQSKTATALLAVELQRRGQPYAIEAFSVHPGRIETDLQRHLAISDLQAMGFRDSSGEIPEEQRHLYKSVAQGAATTVWCATHPRLQGHGGVYCEDVDIANAVSADHQALNGVMPWATDPAQAERLWTLGRQLLTAA